MATVLTLEGRLPTPQEGVGGAEGREAGCSRAALCPFSSPVTLGLSLPLPLRREHSPLFTGQAVSALCGHAAGAAPARAGGQVRGHTRLEAPRGQAQGRAEGLGVCRTVPGALGAPLGVMLPAEQGLE